MRWVDFLFLPILGERSGVFLPGEWNGGRQCVLLKAVIDLVGWGLGTKCPWERSGVSPFWRKYSWSSEVTSHNCGREGNEKINCSSSHIFRPCVEYDVLGACTSTESFDSGVLMVSFVN